MTAPGASVTLPAVGAFNVRCCIIDFRSIPLHSAPFCILTSSRALPPTHTHTLSQQWKVTFSTEEFTETKISDTFKAGEVDGWCGNSLKSLAAASLPHQCRCRYHRAQVSVPPVLALINPPIFFVQATGSGTRAYARWAAGAPRGPRPGAAAAGAHAARGASQAEDRQFEPCYYCRVELRCEVIPAWVTARVTAPFYIGLNGFSRLQHRR